MELEAEGKQDGLVIRNANGRLRAMEHWRVGGWGEMRRRKNVVFMGNKLEEPPLSTSAPQEV